MAAHREGPEGLLTRLRSHLAELHDDPNHQLDIKLFDEAEIVLPDVLAGEPHTLLLKDLASSLANDAGDPSPKSTFCLSCSMGIHGVRSSSSQTSIRISPFSKVWHLLKVWNPLID